MIAPEAPEPEDVQYKLPIEAECTDPNDSAAHDPNSERLKKVGRIARGVGKIACVAGFAAIGTVLALNASSYNTDINGIDVVITASTVTVDSHGPHYDRPGLSIDTSAGSLEYPDVDGLPIGLHAAPSFDVQTVQRAMVNKNAFIDGITTDFAAKQDAIRNHFLVHGGVGAAGGAFGGLLVLEGAATIFGREQSVSRQRAGIRIAKAAVSATTAGSLFVAGAATAGAVTYNQNWAEQSHTTGALATVQDFPAQLDKFYSKSSKPGSVVRAIGVIEERLQERATGNKSPATAYNIMTISDMHLMDNYPIVQQYAKQYGVKLIVNTGDEAEFGTRAEMTPAYVASIKAITKTISMIWIAGNHDSPETIEVMKNIPGVTVLGTKTESPDGSYAVTMGSVLADGLTIGGVPDPRVYGAIGADGSDKNSVTDPLEKSAVDNAVAGVPKSTDYDIIMTHEPVAADQINKDLTGQVRQTNAGHTHVQDKPSDIQKKSGNLFLVEGSTGQGGLDNLGWRQRAPLELSVESIAKNCQFTAITRVQLASPTLPSTPGEAQTNQSSQSFGSNASADTIYFKPQKIDANRVCTADQGVGKPTDIPQLSKSVYAVGK